jgi:large subunit ribosomal protein L21
MFAIVRVAGKQYRVESGAQVLVNRLAIEPGNAVENIEVLLVGDGESTQVGAPTVAGASVAATVVRHQLGKKVRIFKYKAKKNYRRRAGARDHQTLLRVDSITV